MQFARECIVIPEGKHEGSLWRPEFQPFAGHLLRAMDTLGFRRFAITGCVQSGKTLVAVVFPLLWHLFELRQSVIFLVPELTMAKKKWFEEIKPVIDKSRYLRRMAYGDSSRSDLRSGSGRRGGFDNTLRFSNGVRLEFMGAVGSDARRSSSTAKVVFKTEVDRTDKAGESSREASAALTVEDRTESWGDDAWIYEECTVTTESGRIWMQKNIGTDSCVHYQCVHCSEHVRPMRNHLTGFENCVDTIEAREKARFSCPSCEGMIDQKQREGMLKRGVVVHRGQTVGRDGSVAGPVPRTEVLSFWWNAFDNNFWTVPRLGMKEWTRLHSLAFNDEDKQSRQKRWTEPAVSEVVDVLSLSMAELSRRVIHYRRRVVPPGCFCITGGVDLRGVQLHYTARAWTKSGDVVEGTAIDFAYLPVRSDHLGPDAALFEALCEYRDKIARVGYVDGDGKTHLVSMSLIDASWKEEVVWRFMLDNAMKGIRGFMPIVGRGQSDPRTPGTYRHPDKITESVLWIGHECHIRKSSNNTYREQFMRYPGFPPVYVNANVDEYKAIVREGYKTPHGQHGALYTFEPVGADEFDLITTYRKQLLSEKQNLVYIDGRGHQYQFTNENRLQNHYGDTDVYCVVAANTRKVPLKSLSMKVEVSAKKESRLVDARTGQPIEMEEGKHGKEGYEEAGKADQQAASAA